MLTILYTTFRYPFGQRDMHASGAECSTLLQADGLAAKRLYRGIPGATPPNTTLHRNQGATNLNRLHL